MKVPKGPTIRDLMKQVSHLRPQDRATATERSRARRDLMRRCPYLFVKRGKTK